MWYRENSKKRLPIEFTLQGPKNLTETESNM